MDNQARLRQRTCCRCCDRRKLGLEMPAPSCATMVMLRSDGRGWETAGRNLYRSHLVEHGQRGKPDTVDPGVDARTRFSLITQGTGWMQCRYSGAA